MDRDQGEWRDSWRSLGNTQEVRNPCTGHKGVLVSMGEYECTFLLLEQRIMKCG